MKAKKVKIDPNGPRLKIDIVFNGLIVASYEYLLFEAQSNQVLERHKGNNQNPYDDSYPLPMPVNSNIGRLIDVRINFVGLDPENYKNFEIRVELYQGDQKLDEVIDAGKITGETQVSQLFLIIEK